MDQDERPIYSDVGMFTRGRAGYRPDPTPKANLTDVLVSVLALAILAATFYVAIRFAPPALLNTIFQTIPVVIFPTSPPL